MSIPMSDYKQKPFTGRVCHIIAGGPSVNNFVASHDFSKRAGIATNGSILLMPSVRHCLCVDPLDSIWKPEKKVSVPVVQETESATFFPVVRTKRDKPDPMLCWKWTIDPETGARKVVCTDYPTTPEERRIEPPKPVNESASCKGFPKNPKKRKGRKAKVNESASCKGFPEDDPKPTVLEDSAGLFNPDQHPDIEPIRKAVFENPLRMELHNGNRVWWLGPGAAVKEDKELGFYTFKHCGIAPMEDPAEHGCWWGGSVAMAACEIGRYLGARKFVIWGLDYTDGTHAYDKKDSGFLNLKREWNMGSLLQRWGQIREAYRQMRCNIYNANPNSALRVLEFVPVDKALSWDWD